MRAIVCCAFCKEDPEALRQASQLLGNPKQMTREGSRESRGTLATLGPQPSLHFHSPPPLVDPCTYNAATGGIIKEGVLVLDVVPGDTKKTEGRLIS